MECPQYQHSVEKTQTGYMARTVPEDALPLKMLPKGLLFLAPTRTPGPLMQSRRSRAWGRALCAAILPARLMRQTSQSRSMHRDT